MMNYYQINETKGILNKDSKAGNWLVLEQATAEEQEKVIHDYELPEDIFSASDEAEEISRYEQIENDKLEQVTILSLTNLSDDTEKSIEERLEPLIFIWSESIIITYVGDRSEFSERFIDKYAKQVTSLEKLCAYVILMIYTHYIKELLEIKKTIDDLDRAARKTTENEELFRLADTKRNVVYLDHTLRGQEKTLDYLWHETDMEEKLNDKKLLYNIKLRQAHAEELIIIYRDLLETVGGLFGDMMDNNLNHLMKYLDSAALLISIPALISGIWGMNTGGLPGKGSNIGFFIVIIISIIVTTLVAIHLKRKDYTK